MRKLNLLVLNGICFIFLLLFTTSTYSADPIREFQNGQPIDADDINQNFQKLFNALVPIGTVVAWHKSFANTPTLGDGWAECNGQTIDDPDSVYNGQSVPDLNNTKRFIRGGTTSGIEQSDLIRNHGHGLPYNHHHPQKSFTPSPYRGFGHTFDTGYWRVNGTHGVSGGLGGEETRPVNMSMVWIIRIK